MLRIVSNYLENIRKCATQFFPRRKVSPLKEQNSTPTRREVLHGLGIRPHTCTITVQNHVTERARVLVVTTQLE